MEKKIIALIIFFVVIIVGSFFIFNSFYNKQAEVGFPEITVFDTAKVLRGIDDYEKETSFFRGDKIYVYQEYNNVTHQEKSDFYLNISVYDSQRNIYFYYEETVKKVETGCYYFFTTNTSWPSDVYIVFSYLEDHISNLNTSDVTTFYLS